MLISLMTSDNAVICIDQRGFYGLCKASKAGGFIIDDINLA